ncbi:hypothetical protein BBF96_10935 [Anoxybacter fermentans]|uniref:Uncharacterized protein n=1 Tax=Anoxybacter fermentans TaxID=1323375 RepID=A0A3Q9HR53_9FIRM|nr:hypothetical protein [Anoxybacter fermentans]AZR73856.1 hypothetical protein BBF96_10935 [Anoxybacter fermentans]
MKGNFRQELAKLFMIVACGLVLVMGLFVKVSIEVLVIRIFVGGGIFAVIGYLLGIVIDQEQERLLIEEQKKKLKARMKANYKKARNSKTRDEGDFEPLDLDKLTKIVVDSLED